MSSTQIFYVPVSILCFLISYSYGWAANDNLSQCTYIVIPSGTCMDSIPVPCNTLGYYMQNPHIYFQSYSIVCFLSGIHVLDTGTATIENLLNITFIGLGTFVKKSIQEKVNEFNFTLKFDGDPLITVIEPTANIQCGNSSGFLFRNIISLSLINLTVLNCGVNVTDTLSYIQQTSPIDTINTLLHYVAVLMINVSNLNIEAISIQNSTGYGLMGINILGQSQITRSSFVGNNQFVKSNLQLYSAAATYCNDGSNYNTPSFYVNSANEGKNVYPGGNAIFIFDELYVSNYSMRHVLNISFCLFALGIDGSIGLSNGNVYSTFTSMGTGLGIWMMQDAHNFNIIITNTVTYANQAFSGANIYLMVNPASVDVILSNVHSARGISWIGGGLYFSINPTLYTDIGQNQIVITNSSFSTDYNPDFGIYITVLNQAAVSVLVRVQIEHCNLSSNLVVFSAFKNVLAIIDSSYFNTPGCSGGIGAYYASLQLSNCTFNRTNLFASESDVEIADGIFANSLFSPNELYYSHLILTGNVTYVNNKVTKNGGALSLYNSDVTITAPANLKFLNNVAQFRGGAIYVYTKDGDTKCSFIFNDPNGTLDNPGVHIYFEGNIAASAGNVLYGGDIDICSYNCTLTPNYELCTSYGYMATILREITNYTNNGNTTAMISSDPRSVCSCTNLTVDCYSAPGPTRAVYPGQIFNIPIIIVGQLLGASPDIVLSYTCEVDNHQSSLLACSIPSLDDQFQQTRQYCTNYSYLVVGDDQVHTMEVSLVPKSAYIESYLYSSYSTFIVVLPCPFGFMLDNSSKMCTCSSVLKKYNIECNIGNLSVFRTANFWIGNNSAEVLVVHNHCPYDYCTHTDMSFSLLHDQDEQCNHHHSGILCGGCKPNFSAVFGSTQCKQCNNQYLWVILLISIMGLAMVALIFLLNCTVSAGTLNGLILYANIIKPGIIIFVHSNSQNAFETFFVFIDWLNLDFGIETCFYDGMDMYAKTWLELLFPLYILALVGAIIIGSRWSSKLAWLSKRNAVPVLATLILLSYTTFLQSVISILTYTQLDSDIIQKDSNPPVWLSDGNVLYVNGRHTYLFIVALIIVIAFIIPYTSILLLSPWMQTKSHWKVLCWVNKLKPFIDAYQAPFKDRYRYWPGIQLLLRVVLYIVFTTNQANELYINLLACALVIGIYCGAANFFSIYKNVFLNILEIAYMANIWLLSTSMLYIHIAKDTQHILTIISIASALLVFVMILIFHLNDLVQMYKKWKQSKTISRDIPPISYAALKAADQQKLNYYADFREPLLDDN